MLRGLATICAQWRPPLAESKEAPASCSRERLESQSAVYAQKNKNNKNKSHCERVAVLNYVNRREAKVTPRCHQSQVCTKSDVHCFGVKSGGEAGDPGGHVNLDRSRLMFGSRKMKLENPPKIKVF